MAAQGQEAAFVPPVHFAVVQVKEDPADLLPVRNLQERGQQRGIPHPGGQGFQVRGFRLLREEGQAAEHRARVHVDQIVHPHARLNLPQGHPPVGRKLLDLLFRPDNHIPDPLPPKAGGQLGLNLIHQDILPAHLPEQAQIRRLLPAVPAGKVALRGLQCRGDLDIIDISRFNLRLHQKVPGTVYFTADNAQVADLRLQYDRLGYPSPRSVSV